MALSLTRPPKAPPVLSAGSRRKYGEEPGPSRHQCQQGCRVEGRRTPRGPCPRRTLRGRRSHARDGVRRRRRLAHCHARPGRERILHPVTVPVDIPEAIQKVVMWVLFRCGPVRPPGELPIPRGAGPRPWCAGTSPHLGPHGRPRRTSVPRASQPRVQSGLPGAADRVRGPVFCRRPWWIAVPPDVIAPDYRISVAACCTGQ